MKIRQVITAGAMLIPFSVFAGEADADKTFKTLDKNSDGVITKEEAATAKKLIEDWTVIDANKSGTIEMTEFSALESVESYVPVETEEEPIGAAPTK
ncbi:MAG: hypothetical protein L0Z73_15560 [Gammaproteobacteria bacterium]|nr:hypothetical protein [Gammaproteobacteria bacterium]